MKYHTLTCGHLHPPPPLKNKNTLLRGELQNPTYRILKRSLQQFCIAYHRKGCQHSWNTCCTWYYHTVGSDGASQPKRTYHRKMGRTLRQSLLPKAQWSFHILWRSRIDMASLLSLNELSTGHSIYFHFCVNNART